MLRIVRRQSLRAAVGVLLLAQALLAGCAMRPSGEKPERARIEQAGMHYTQPMLPPELPECPAPEEYLEYALRNNADLQARYWEWASAIEQVPQDSSYPRLALGFDNFFDSKNLLPWQSNSLRAATDTMENIPFPSKLASRGRIALASARAAGARFDAARYLLQQQVLDTYYDLALLGESLRIREESVALLKMAAEQSVVRLQTGASSQTETLRAQTAVDLTQNELYSLRAQAPGLTAQMNALLGRSAEGPVPLPSALPEPRPLPVQDDELLQFGAERNPELAALARDVAGRKEALNLAKQRWLPDFSLSVGLAGEVFEQVGVMFMLPTQVESIRGGIAQARADIARAEAARTQYARDLAASFVLNLYILRNSERQIELFGKTIIPRAEQIVSVAAGEYGNGQLTFAEMLDAQGALLDARLSLAQVRIEREKALAAIEASAAVELQAAARADGAAAAGRVGSGAGAQGSEKASGSGGGMQLP